MNETTLSDRVLILETNVRQLVEDRANDRAAIAEANHEIVEELKLLRKDVEALKNKLWMAVGAVSAITWLIQLLKH